MVIRWLVRIVIISSERAYYHLGLHSSIALDKTLPRLSAATAILWRLKRNKTTNKLIRSGTLNRFEFKLCPWDLAAASKTIRTLPGLFTLATRWCGVYQVIGEHSWAFSSDNFCISLFDPKHRNDSVSPQIRFFCLGCLDFVDLQLIVFCCVELQYQKILFPKSFDILTQRARWLYHKLCLMKHFNFQLGLKNHRRHQEESNQDLFS